MIVVEAWRAPGQSGEEAADSRAEDKARASVLAVGRVILNPAVGLSLGR